jgi:hypothetical protein
MDSEAEDSATDDGDHGSTDLEDEEDDGDKNDGHDTDTVRPESPVDDLVAHPDLVSSRTRRPYTTLASP